VLDLPALVRQIEPSIVAVSATTRFGPAGEGSAVLVREDGVIVTNHHVIDGADAVVVAFADGSQIPADVEAADPVSDLAVLRVDRDDLPAARPADGYPQVGETAIAVGNPLGFESTVTAGIVSGVGRSIPARSAQGGLSLVDLIQTDAAISPGNSGGALVGADGRIIGINVAYIPPSAGAVSLGFAIPAPTVRDVVDELLEDGTADHAYLGPRLATVTPQISTELDLDASSGAAIIAVERDGPAATAGLSPGVVITVMDGEPVRIERSAKRVRTYLGGHLVADTTSPRAMITARSTAFFSSRTFPGQLYDTIQSQASSEKPLIFFPFCCANRSRNSSASSLMSPTRSRSGGRNSSTTARR